MPGAACRAFIQRIHLFRPADCFHPGPHVCGGSRGRWLPFRRAARRGQHPGHADAEKINAIDAIDDYIKEVLDTGGKLMGLGHAVYKTGDPRARILAPMSKNSGSVPATPNGMTCPSPWKNEGKSL
ncbi:MAG: citrate/2-methylcitrate synthase [Desulfobacterales bacterium]